MMSKSRAMMERNKPASIRGLVGASIFWGVLQRHALRGALHHSVGPARHWLSRAYLPHMLAGRARPLWSGGVCHWVKLTSRLRKSITVPYLLSSLRACLPSLKLT